MNTDGNAYELTPHAGEPDAAAAEEEPNAAKPANAKNKKATERIGAVAFLFFAFSVQNAAFVLIFTGGMILDGLVPLMGDRPQSIAKRPVVAIGFFAVCSVGFTVSPFSWR